MKIKSILSSFFTHFFTKDLYNKTVFVNSLSDVPRNPQTDIYIVKNNDKQKWVVFACPNKCGKRIEVNLMQSRQPFWLLKMKKKKVSLSPSIVVTDCGAHFWLRNNNVEWSFDSDN